MFIEKQINLSKLLPDSDLIPQPLLTPTHHLLFLPPVPEFLPEPE